ncbi:MAG: hypothetical protein ACFFA3_06590 [Promethearchaeota archaeon]
MNEITILMHLLSKKQGKFHIGASREDILEKLNLNGKNESIYFEDLITQLSSYIEPLGLQVRFNPISSTWFIAFGSESSDFVSANPFANKPRLASTLFYTIVCCLERHGQAKIQNVKDLRKKKHVIDDLKELEKLGYIELDKNLGTVRLTPLIGYQLDLNKLIINLALKVKK